MQKKEEREGERGWKREIMKERERERERERKIFLSLTFHLQRDSKRDKKETEKYFRDKKTGKLLFVFGLRLKQSSVIKLSLPSLYRQYDHGYS